jgi:sigma-E factor negative regulatory protein RseA
MTMQKISELVDGEIEGHEAAGACSALKSGGEAREAWHRYHLISDAMRDTRLLSAGFTERVASRLAEEPTVLAPAANPLRVRANPWYAGAIAASLAVAFVGYFTFEQNSAPQMVQAPKTEAAAVAAAEPSEAAKDYLHAHQGYSPRNALQGYIHTVSGKAARKP